MDNYDTLTNIVAIIAPHADEFQRIAISECFRDTEGCELGQGADEKFARLGAIVLEAMEAPRG